MPDISKCIATGCPIKDYCYRHTSKDESAQTYLMHPPFQDTKDGIHCDLYWYNSATSVDPALKDTINEYLVKEYGEGYTSGGSGHMSHVSNDLSLVNKIPNSRLIIGYTIYIESEFTTTSYFKVVIMKFDENKPLLKLNELMSSSERIEDDLGF